MPLPRRLYPLAAIASLALCILLFTGLHHPITTSLVALAPITPTLLPTSPPSPPLPTPSPFFQPGRPKPPGSNYTRALVIARLSTDDTSWLTSSPLLSPPDSFPSLLQPFIYTADDPSAPLHPPKNKGHEVMIYLTFLITHYHSPALPDIVLFMHAHRWSYHNNALHSGNALQIIAGLSSERVVREGYVNLRCHWREGCPAHLRPLAAEPDFHRIQGIMAAQWPLLFPSDLHSHSRAVPFVDAAGHEPIPETLAQPCCAQFAVSRERIRSIPLETYVHYRDWLLRTPLTNYYSGRLWEYLWQYVFTRHGVVCPQEHVCYCDGFGLCFGGEEGYAAYGALGREKEDAEGELREWRERKEKARWMKAAGREGEGEEEVRVLLETVEGERGGDVRLQARIDALGEEMERRMGEARARGREPARRAEEAGRVWRAGDGF